LDIELPLKEKYQPPKEISLSQLDLFYPQKEI
jgi:hypothetical protein